MDFNTKLTFEGGFEGKYGADGANRADKSTASRDTTSRGRCPLNRNKKSEAGRSKDTKTGGDAL